MQTTLSESCQRCGTVLIETHCLKNLFCREPRQTWECYHFLCFGDFASNWYQDMVSAPHSLDNFVRPERRKKHKWLFSKNDVSPCLDIVYNDRSCIFSVTFSFWQLFERGSNKCQCFVLGICAYCYYCCWPLQVIDDLGHLFFATSSDKRGRNRWRRCLAPICPEQIEGLNITRVFANQARNPDVNGGRSLKPCFKVICINDSDSTPFTRCTLPLCPILFTSPAAGSDKDKCRL